MRKARKTHDPPTFLSTNILDTLRLFRYVVTYVATCITASWSFVLVSCLLNMAVFKLVLDR